MRNEDTLSVEGMAFTVRQLPVRRGHAVVFRLVKALGPMLMGLTPKDEQSKLGVDLSDTSMAEALQALREEDYEYVLQAMIDCTTVSIDGGPQVSLSSVYDAAFVGRWSQWLTWLGFALRTNFRSFFSGPTSPLSVLNQVKGQ